MRLAITGRNGQVTRAIQERAVGKDFDLILLARPHCELSETVSVKNAVVSTRPDIIISAAAYTAVDRAENEPRIAHSINTAGVRAIGEAACEIGIPVLHLSTDYVFSGEKQSPYTEADIVGPQSVYGLSKLAGEQALAETNPNHVILRTAWVYSPFGTNFVKTMLKIARERGEVRVVADQFGNPTSALDIAAAVLMIARAVLQHPNDPKLRGVFHLAAAGEASWAAFAASVFEISEQLGGPAARVIPIPSSAYATAAKRPANSRLCCDKLASTYNIALPNWRASLGETVRRLLNGERI